MNTEVVASSVPTQSIAAQPLFPFLDLKAQFQGIRSEILAAIEAVMESQHFILGPEVERLEKEVGRLTGAEFSISCASGSDALLLSLMVLGVGRDDEVITTPFTFGATAGAIARLGARPVFVDIDPETFNIDPIAMERALTRKTRVIIPVHLFGLVADMDAISAIADQRGVAVVEDAAQSLGAAYKSKQAGTMGTLGCFSFFPSKNLGAAGDGGLITTNSPELATQLKALRIHGAPKKYEYQLLGINSRLDALQAAILRVKLPYLQSWTDGRRENAETYRQLFREHDLLEVVRVPTESEGCVHVYNQFSIRVSDRDALRQHLQNCGIPTEIYYPSPLHLQPAYAYLGHKSGDFPKTEAACREVLSLPIYPELTQRQLQAVVSAIASFYSAKSKGE